jgi:hypothetical protein
MSLQRRPALTRSRWFPLTLALGGCTLHDASVAREAQRRLIGMNEAELQTCLGVPVRRSTFGQSSVLTYASTTNSGGGVSLSLPVIGGISLSGGGYSCNANIRLDDGRVTQVRYSGDATAPLAENAYCAPIVRDCVENPPDGVAPSDAAVAEHRELDRRAAAR